MSFYQEGKNTKNFKTGWLRILANFNLLDNGENLLTLLVDKADVSLLLCILIFADSRSVLEGRITSGCTGQIYTVWMNWSNCSDYLDPACQIIEVNGVINLK